MIFTLSPLIMFQITFTNNSVCKAHGIFKIHETWDFKMKLGVEFLKILELFLILFFNLKNP